MTARGGLRAGTYHRADGVLSRRTGSSLLLFIRDDRRLLKVSGSAVALWEALAVPRSAQAATEVLAEAFKVDPDDVRPEITGALADLVAHGAVRSPEPAP